MTSRARLFVIRNNLLRPALWVGGVAVAATLAVWIYRSITA